MKKYKDTFRRCVKKLGNRLRRPLLAFILMAFVGGSIVGPAAKPVEAAEIGVPNPVPFLPDPSITIPGTGGDSSGSSSTSRDAGSGRYFKTVGWNQIDSVDDARRFFGVSRSSDNLAYRLRVGPYQITNSNAIQDAVRFTKKKPAIEVFRMVRSGSGVAYVPITEYNNPVPSDHRNLTLRAGAFGQSDQWVSALDTFAESSGGVVGTALSLGGSAASGAITGAFDGVFGGDDSHAVWVFSGDGNKNVQNTLTCDDQDNRGSRFVYSDSEPLITALRATELTEEQRIANINRVGSGSGYTTRNFDESNLAAYLCAPKTKEQFDKLCQDDLDLPPAACPSDERSIGDALKGLLPNLDPLAWALGKLRDIVGFFMGFVVEGLRSITDIGNLSSNSGVTEAWKVMRDLVNILFVLILVALAFSTILRLDEKKYSVRALLPRLIFAIIGVNFSLLLMTILINTATIVGAPFLSGLNSVLDQNPASNVDSFTSIGGAGQQMVLLLASIAITVVLLMLLLLFVVRIVMIWILGALAPFAFLFSVMPFSRSLATQWLKQTLKWVYMAPVSFAILWIGSLFLAAADTLGAGIISVLVFIGVVIAAVIIPLRLGGEIMQKAASGGSRIGKQGLGSTKTGRTASAYLGRRKEAQDQAANLRATSLQGSLSRNLPDRLGATLTGGNAAQIGAQQAALENKYGQDIQQMGAKVGSTQRKQIVEGDSAALKAANLPEAAALAESAEGRRAAGKLLAQDGMLTQGYLSSLPNDRKQEQIEAGNQAYMKGFDPVLASIASNGKRSPQSIEGIKSHIGSVGPEATKEMYWDSIHQSSFAPGDEGEAGRAALGSVTSVAAADNVKEGGRHRISNDKERDAFITGVMVHGNDAAKHAVWKQIKDQKSELPAEYDRYEQMARHLGLEKP